MLSRIDYTIYTLPIFDMVTVMVRVRSNVQIKYTWDAVTSVNLTYLWSDINDAILCVRQIVYMNNALIV